MHFVYVHRAVMYWKLSKDMNQSPRILFGYIYLQRPYSCGQQVKHLIRELNGT